MRPVGAAGGNWDFFGIFFCWGLEIEIRSKVRHQHEVGDGGDV